MTNSEDRKRNESANQRERRRIRGLKLKADRKAKRHQNWLAKQRLEPYEPPGEPSDTSNYTPTPRAQLWGPVPEDASFLEEVDALLQELDRAPYVAPSPSL